MDNENPVKQKKSNKSTLWLVLILVAAVVFAFIWWWNYRKYISTDDANLDTYRVNVSSRVMAPILSIYAWEGDSIKAGMLLVELDSSNIKAQLKESIAQRDEMVANLVLDKQNLKSAKSNLKLAEIAFKLAGENYQRAKIQFEGKAIPLEVLQTQEEAFESAKVRIDMAKSQIDVSMAQIASAESAIAAAEASIESVQTNLGYYRIYAPTDGLIAKRWYLPGDIIQPGQTLYTINEGKEIWVMVYLEETKFQHIRLNQPADFILDAYPDLTFKGKIFYIGTNAASEFSLIPPNNASGNYTKVAQRIPIKISIDEVSGPHHSDKMPKLVSGMSATVKIIKGS